MKIAVIISQTPDTATKIKIAEDGKSLDEADITWIINPYSEFAIEKALLLKEAAGDAIEEIILVAMGPERTTEALRQGLAMGADRAVLIKSEHMNTQVLADEIKKLDAGLILGGKKTIDTESSWTEAGVAALMDLAMVPHANKVEWADGKIIASRELGGAKETFEITAPALITCDKGNDEPRYASIMGIMKAKKKPLDEVDHAGEDNIGIEIIESHLPPARKEVQIFEGASNEESVKSLLTALRDDAKVL